MAFQTATLIVEAVAAAGLIITLVLILRQFGLQRKDLEHRIYQQISDRYSELLWRAAEDSRLDDAWRPLSSEQRAWIADRATEDDRWAVWAALDSADPTMPFDGSREKRIYRYTRASLELCEQAFLAYKSEAVGFRVWNKFEAVLRSWTTSRWFAEVLNENRSRFDDEFCAIADGIVQPRA